MAGPDRRDWPAPPAGGGSGASRRDHPRHRPDSSDYGDPRRDGRPRDRRQPGYPPGHYPAGSRGPPSGRDSGRGDYYRDSGSREAWRSPPRDGRSSHRSSPPFVSPADRSKRQRLDEPPAEPSRPSGVQSASPRPAGNTSTLPTTSALPRLGGGLMDSGLLAEVRKAALAKLAEQEKQGKPSAHESAQAATATEVALGQLQAEMADQEDEPEPGEVPTERSPLPVPRRTTPRQAADAQAPPPLATEAAAVLRGKSRTPPIQPGGAESSGRTADVTMSDIAPGRSAADLALQELGAFQDRQHADDIDPDAPPAMKASPSGSDESGLSQPRESEEQPGSAKAAAAAAATGLRSRWLADAEDETDANAEAQREQAEIAALNALERQDMDGPSPNIEPVSDGDEPLNPLPVMRAISMLNSCRRVENYEKIHRISEGTYGVVFKAKEKASEAICALKKVKISKDRDRDGFPLTALREVNVLLSLYHPCIVNVTEVVVGNSLDSVYMVMEFMDHELKALMEDMQQAFSTSEVKCLFQQLLQGIQHLHDNWVIHRDIKTSNILYNNAGELKICDFGLARQYGSPLRPYTHNVVTLYYRAPELLLGGQGMKYSTAVDMWSCGCILAELLTKEVLFPARGELDALDRMFKLLGSPTEDTWPGFKKMQNAKHMNWSYAPFSSRLQEKFPRPTGLIETPGTLSEKGFDLLSRLLSLNPAHRLSAADAVNHPWFSEHPLPKDKRLMPTFKVKHREVNANGARRQKAAGASPDPRLAARTAEVSSLFSRPAAH